ncbi:MAG: hydroxymethylbilane synthase [Firmicutes bacterium]|nr:hydroxymethylbilane synthase [Bacillota bacterium]
MRAKVVVGSRGSELALRQAQLVVAELQKHFPEVDFKIKTIKTAGDKILDLPLPKLEGKGFFVKEIEHALLAGEIDMAVHSMKDVPTVLPAGLTLSAITKREDARDCYLAQDGKTGLFDSPPKARIGTSSLRRAAQILARRPDLEIVPIRGNLNTRLRKLTEMDLAGIVLAYAGVSRLGWTDKITEIIETDKILPAVGQGALGIETRQGDTEIINMVKTLHDSLAAAAVVAERAFLRTLEGGCQTPIAAWGRVEKDQLVLEGMVGDLRGEKILRRQVSGAINQAEALGRKLAQMLLQEGAAALIEQVRREY